MRSSRPPCIDDYYFAFQNHHHFLFDEELCKCDVDKEGNFPKSYPGGTTITFHLKNNKNHWAVRCFHIKIQDLEKRYSALSYFMKEKNPYMFVPTECIPKGIFLNEDEHAIIKMRWVDGIRLDQFLSKYYNNSDVLIDFTKKFRKVVQYLEMEGIAHGDLQHGNIIIENGKIILIDYDGVFLPSIEILGSSEVGHPNYQHPLRCKEQPFDNHLDRFSAIVIYLSIVAIVENPRLFQKPEYHNQENIIFTKTDFDNPENSNLFNELIHQESTKYFVENFFAICKGKMEDIPSLEDFISNSNVDSVQNEGKRVYPSEIFQTKPNSNQGTNIRPIEKKIERSKLVLDDILEEIEMYSQLLEHNPNNIEYLTKLAVLYKNNEFYVEALDMFNRLKRIDKNAGQNYPLKKEISALISKIGEAKRSNTTKEKFRTFNQWAKYGIDLQKKGDLQGAKIAYDEAYKLDPNHTEIKRLRKELQFK